MIQRQTTHPTGSFDACAGCRREPRHYVAIGSVSHEDPIFSPKGERHQLECACERRTGWCNTLVEAMRIWGELGATLPPPMAEAKSNVRPISAYRASDPSVAGAQGAGKQAAAGRAGAGPVPEDGKPGVS